MIEGIINNDNHKSPDHSAGRIVKFHPEYLDDATLWRAFRNGDDAALITIFDLHAQALYNYGYKIMNDKEAVRDTIQDLFADLCQSRSGLGDTNAIRFYLFKSLRRRLIRLKIKVKSFQSFTYFPHDNISPSHEFVLISEQVSDEQRQRISDTLSGLSLKQQEAIFFRYQEDLSYDQIVEVMGIRKRTVYNLINEAIKALRKNLK